jgi:sugar lactone lactonase YvrE
MKNYLLYYLLITLSIILNSCTEGFKEEYSKINIALTEVTAITTPTTDTTPDYTFSSTGSGAITYGGSCSSSTTIATTGNNTITLSSLSDGTYADCTITVSKTISTEKSEKKLSGSLTITSFTVSSTDDSSSYIPSWQLIAKQVDSDNFTNGTDELFSSNARTTYLENENDPSSSTFMSIGNLTRSNYVTDGKYKFKLVWDGLAMASETIKEVTWSQTSWLTDTTAADFQGIPDNGTSGYVNNSSSGFRGLAKSTYSSCVIDGDGGTHSHWFNCVGTIAKWGGDSMPGPLAKKASSMHLYIWAPESSTQMGGSIQGVEPDLSTAVTTFAGSTYGYTNDTGTSAEFYFPRGITTDGTNLYVADQNNHKIRKIVITTGVVTILAGSTSGTPSDSKGNTDATGTSARFDLPTGITTDGTNLYVTDTDNHRIRKIVISTGVVTTLAGSSSGNTDATGTSAQFSNPIGITTDGTNLYVADKGNHRIRKIVISTGVVTTLAGSSQGSTDATGTSASFNTPVGITTDGTNLYVAEKGNHRIRKIVISTGVVTTLAGSSSGNTDATGTSASFNNPVGITTDGTNLYVADKGNHRIRKIVISTGVVTTLAGSSSGFANHNTGTSARFNAPQGITTDGTNLYVSDNGNHKIRKID